MLLKYSVSNFRSFRDKVTLSMQAGSQRTLGENVLKRGRARILPVAVVYGANASGKSNLVMSLRVMQDIVLAGSLHADGTRLNRLETYPFFFRDVDEPMQFEIEFVHGNMRVTYGFSILCPSFKKEERRVVAEALSVEIKNKKITLFERNAQGVVLTSEREALALMKMEQDFLEELLMRVNIHLGHEELFLSTVFKNAVSSDLADIVTDFFRHRLVVVDDLSSVKAMFEFVMEDSEDPPDDLLVWNEILHKFVKGADFGPQKMAFYHKKRSDGSSGPWELVSMYEHGEKRVMVRSDLMESHGTLKLLEFALPFNALFKRGGVLVFDEFDASLHPELVKGLIALFNDSQFNTEGAQLIFTTHNPIYLNNKIFRRDQILFVEKSPDTFESTLYSLADFGSTTVRNDHNYLLNYFKGNYGALPFVDFSHVLQDDDEGPFAGVSE